MGPMLLMEDEMECVMVDNDGGRGVDGGESAARATSLRSKILRRYLNGGIRFKRVGELKRSTFTTRTRIMTMETDGQWT